jgi:hypothetical protein
LFRSLSYLSGIAREFTNDPEATYEALFGEYMFEAGQQLALARSQIKNCGSDFWHYRYSAALYFRC